ncbi:Bromodomain containing protein [Histomonas meleagridis]|uniref:Bromodomain containing protein n=1 Tax=Histomonas meleagridis TaxID=135588 RepID=UPI0035593B35|nr:Bromodomain containing protein [Histomonas meleagridis]KAH0801211.1 Bromodomain containing protein [Histomonas meleagridis]
MMERCKSITAEIRQKQIACAFAVPVEQFRDQLEGYDEIVKKPMDLSTVEDKLKNQKYRNTSEWYEDMRLVFQNAIDYYPEGDSLSLIAIYLLDVFEKMAIGLNIETDQAWVDEVNRVSNKLSKLIGSPPSAQKSTQLISELRQKSAQIATPKPQEIPAIVDKLNNIVNDDDQREIVFAILRDIQDMPIEEAASKPIDLEKLSPAAMKTLIYFSQTL